MRVWAGSGRQIVARDVVGRFWPPGCGSGCGRQRCYPNHVFAALEPLDECALYDMKVWTGRKWFSFAISSPHQGCIGRHSIPRFDDKATMHVGAVQKSRFWHHRFTRHGCASVDMSGA